MFSLTSNKVTKRGTSEEKRTEEGINMRFGQVFISLL